jgi:hypothetical protein
MANSFDLVASILGWLGASLLLLAYFLRSGNRLQSKGVYHSMNLVGAAGLALSTGYVQAYPAMVLNIVWMGIALSALRTLDRSSGTSGRMGE